MASIESLTDPPAADEFEVSLFGPGVGECIACHLGGGDWIIVDSCIDRTTGNPVVLDYLRRLGLRPETAVRMVVVSHWHDDHIRGASHVVKAAPDAEVVFSAALRSKEFFKVVGARSYTGTTGTDTDEMSEILAELKRRGSGRIEGRGPKWAIESQRLFFREGGTGRHQAEVFALSPAPASLTLAAKEFAKHVPLLGETKRRVVSQSPNEVAVVLWIEVSGVCALLGSDLEETGSEAGGWKAILASTTRPQGKAEIFKVPHHGSATSHNSTVWTQMLLGPPIAILTPYLRGKALPAQDDVQRLIGLTPSAFCSAPPFAPKPVKRPPAIEKTVKAVVRSMRRREGSMGMIRVRRKLGSSSPGKVTLAGQAFKLPGTPPSSEG